MSSSIKLKNANGKTLSVTNSNANQTDKEVIYLNTVDELANASGSINAVAIVSDLNRGGTFVWSSTGTANGGTVFAGATGYWNRQYSGAVNVKWFGAVGDGIVDDTVAFQKTDITNVPILIPDGTYLCNGYIPIGLYFGNGNIKLTNVTNDIGESLSYTYALDKAVPTRISQNVLDYNSGSLYEQDYNIYIGQDCATNTKATDGMVVAIGGMALHESGNGTDSSYRITSIGAHSLRRALNPFSITAIGDSACENGLDMHRLVAVGSNSLQFAGDIDPVAHSHEFFTQTDPYGLETRNDGFRTYVGTSLSPNYIPTTASDAQESVALGRNAQLHNLKTDNDVSVGYNALAHGYNTVGNVAVGAAALRDGVKAVANVAVGRSAASQTQTATGNVVIGADAFFQNVHTQHNTIIGYRSAYNLTGDSITEATARTNARQNVAIGAYSMENAIKGVNNTAIGNASLKSLNGGTQNSAIGAIAGELLQTGSNNTFLGYSSGRLNVDGTNATARTNCTYVGFNTRVTGDNQVQLGDSGTTTYVYGTVQNRSDKRDKSDIEDSPLGLEFINKLRPVAYKWDIREDYLVSHEDGTITKYNKDGSKKRNRKHYGLIAQEVKEVIDELAVDFGGYQDHSINGGCDVLSLGYDEFIAPLIKAVQQLSQEIEILKKSI